VGSWTSQLKQLSAQTPFAETNQTRTVVDIQLSLLIYTFSTLNLRESSVLSAAMMTTKLVKFLNRRLFPASTSQLQCGIE
jgi:hypothetical protein